MVEDITGLREVVEQICETAVDAIFRYHKLTDWSPRNCPESFIESYILDRLGDRISLNSQISLQKLWCWIRDDSDKNSPDQGGQKLDLVINDNTKTPIKKCQDVWAIVELKRPDRGVRGVEEDKRKLKEILPQIRNCPFGVVVGIEKYPNARLEEETRKNGRFFIRSKPKSCDVDGERKTFVGFAYLMDQLP